VTSAQSRGTQGGKGLAPFTIQQVFPSVLNCLLGAVLSETGGWSVETGSLCMTLRSHFSPTALVYLGLIDLKVLLT
jgi:hypothetical protein